MNEPVQVGDVFRQGSWVFRVLGVSPKNDEICTETWRVDRHKRHIHRTLPLPSDVTRLRLVYNLEEDSQ